MIDRGLRYQRIGHAVEHQRHGAGRQVDGARLGDQREQIPVDSHRDGIGAGRNDLHFVGVRDRRCAGAGTPRNNTRRRRRAQHVTSPGAGVNVSVVSPLAGDRHVPGETVGIGAAALDGLGTDLVHAPQIVLPQRQHDRAGAAHYAPGNSSGIRWCACSRASSAMTVGGDGDVERIADAQRDVRTRAGVTDAILTDELRLPARIARIDAHDAARAVVRRGRRPSSWRTGREPARRCGSSLELKPVKRSFVTLGRLDVARLRESSPASSGCWRSS